MTDYTALCAVMRYSPQDPPKSPLKRGTFTAPLFKGGWGDRNAGQSSENCCICMDANFAVRLVNSKSETDPWIVLWEEWEAADKQIIAPTLFYYEITNAIYRMGRAGQLEEYEVQTA